MAISIDLRQKLYHLIPEGSFVTRDLLLTQGITHHTNFSFLKILIIGLSKKLFLIYQVTLLFSETTSKQKSP